MAGYKGFEKKKSKLGTTLLIVGIVHLGIGGGCIGYPKPNGART